MNQKKAEKPGSCEASGVIQKRIGRASATTASVAPDAFRVLARSTQVLRVFWAQKERWAVYTIRLMFGARRGLGHAGATPAPVIPDAFRVLARSTQVLRVLWAQKKR